MGIGAIADPDIANIKSLVNQREQARAKKDFTRSDELRDQLKGMGVEVFDKEKMWKSSTGATGVVLGYRGLGGPTDLEITTLVAQREKARQNKDWTLSDNIRNELKAVGCEIYDKEKVWKTNDGRQGPVPSYQQVGGTAMPGVMPGVGGCSGVGMMSSAKQSTPIIGTPAPLLQVIAKTAALAAKNAGDMAPQLLQLLQQINGGPVNKAGGSARPASQAQPQSSSGTTNPEAMEALSFVNKCKQEGRPATDAEIEWLVGIREKLRQNKDFTAADELRNAMKTGISVELWEKDKRWSCGDGRSGTIPMWTSM